MKRMLVVLVLCVVSVSIAADTKSDAKAVCKTFEAGLRAGNIEQMMSIYANDATLMPPNMPAMMGSDAIRKYWMGLTQGGKVDADLNTDDVMVSGDMAVQRGRYEVKAPVRDSGKYVMVLQKRDGQWRVVTDIFNSDLDPMAPAAK